MQDNFEYDKKIKDELQEKLELPNVVKEKIKQVYIKIEEDKNGERNMEKQTKFKLSKVLSLAASLIVIIFLVGNGVAYAKGEENIYSWILNKMGIQKEYEEIKTEVNQTIESNGLRITLLESAYDSNRFIVGYKVEDLEGKIKKVNEKYQSKLDDNVNGNIYDTMFFEGDHTFYTDKGQKKINPDANMGALDDSIMSEQISDTEFIIYETVIISEVEWDGKITDVDIHLKGLYFLGEDDSITGDWKFKVTELNNKYSNVSFSIMDVNKKIDNELTIKSIRIENPGIFGRIFINYKTETRDVDNCYLFKVVDKNNKRLGEFNLVIAEGMEEPITYKYLSKLEENEEYKILIYKNENYDDIEEGKVQAIYIIPFIYKSK